MESGSGSPARPNGHSSTTVCTAVNIRATESPNPPRHPSVRDHGGRPRGGRHPAVPRSSGPPDHGGPIPRSAIPIDVPAAARRDRPPAAEVAAHLHRAGVTGADAGSLNRALYSTDASLYRVVPAAVAFPRHPEEVVAALEVCRDLGVALTVRGGGTSVAGNAVGPGVVLDLSRHLDGIVDLDPQARTATVQPGVVHADLQRAAARHGLRFGPDPSSTDRCTIGGMIGNDACGSRALGYGRTSHNVLALDAVTGSGQRLRLATDTSSPAAEPPALAAARRAVAADLACVRTEFGTFSRQVSGYALEHLLPEHAGAEVRALVGSEGTLAVVLGATLRLVAEPPQRLLVALGYPSMADAADAVPALLPLHPTACEGLDRRIVDAVRHRYGPSRLPPMPRGSGWLLVEVSGEEEGEVAARARQVVAAAQATDALVVSDPRHAAPLWRIRADGAGLASRTPDGAPAHAGWEDAAVPPAALGAYLRGFEELLAGHRLTGLPYGHFGEGCVHVRLDFPFDRAEGTRRFGEFLADAARLVAAHGGSLSGEHGDGRARSALLPFMYSPRALEAFARLKAAFDPDGVLNPGVLVDPADATADLRPARPALPALARPARTGFAHRADGGDLPAAVHRCTGVGACRADRSASGAVMCPSYRATREEKDSTRGRARVLQEMLDGEFVRGGWRSPEVRAALDLCLSCKACAGECPAGVDLAGLRAEVLYQAYRHRIRPRTHYTLGRLPVWARLAGRAPRVANAVVQAPVMGVLARWAAGVDRRRGLPPFAERGLRSWFAGQRETETDRGPGVAGTAGTAPRGPVLLWVDEFTEHLAPRVGRAAVTVLRAAGYEVRLPRAPVCCGITWISTGQLDGARRRLARALRVIGPELESGMPVLGLEPSCTAVLRHDVLDLLDTPAAHRLAAQTVTLAELLERTEGWEPPPLTGTRVVVQPHCHHRAVLGWETDARLLVATGAQVHEVPGCCGLAGDFGMERGHYEVSVAIAGQHLLPAVREAGEDAVVLADGFSCRTQLDDLAGRGSVHLAELLAGAADGGAGRGAGRVGVRA